MLLIVLRQLGLIYLRSQGGGVQLEEGPPTGVPMIPFSELDDESKEEFRFPDGNSRLALLLFASPHCAICKEVLRGLRVVNRAPDVQVVVLSEGGLEANKELRRFAKEASRFVTSLQRQRALGVTTIPFGIAVDGKTGVVLRKAVVNNLHDVEQLLDDARVQLDTDVILMAGETST